MAHAFEGRLQLLDTLERRAWATLEVTVDDRDGRFRLAVVEHGGERAAAMLRPHQAQAWLPEGCVARVRVALLVEAVVPCELGQ